MDEAGFFCYMSKRKEPGYKQKRDWLEERFAEGMKIKGLDEMGGDDYIVKPYNMRELLPRTKNLARRVAAAVPWAAA